MESTMYSVQPMGQTLPTAVLGYGALTDYHLINTNRSTVSSNFDFRPRLYTNLHKLNQIS